MKNYLLTITYDGTNYHGWQVQNNAPTVQKAMQDAIEQILGATEPKSRASTETSKEMLSLINVLVDGPYIEELHSITLKFRGSSNQRVIDVKKSAEQGKIVLYLE